MDLFFKARMPVYEGEQDVKLPDPELTTKNLVDDYQEQELPRPHLGISQIGHECDRWLWLQFRWAIIPHFSGRMLRLFRRGQLEEITAVADLRRCGFTVKECLEGQIQLDFGCHLKGSPDGTILGIPEAPKTEHVVEFKTHNDKSFKLLKKDGVKKAKFQHYVQMQCYMRKKGLKRALYYAVNKNDDEIYIERVYLDKELADKMIKRGHRIALAETIPEPINTNPSWYKCKYCPAHDFCFGKLRPEVNCRTCAHSTPREDGTWFCERWKATIPVEGQRIGCRSHVIHPDLVLGMTFDPADEWNCYYNGKLVGEDGISSKELLYGDNKEYKELFK